jgi:CIC family chloride channel protein
VSRPALASLPPAGRRLFQATQFTVVLATVTGVLAGLVVAAFERVVQPLVELALDQPWPLLFALPAVGLVAVNVLAGRWGDGDTATTDAYVRAYHQRGGGLGVRAGIRKLVLSAISLATGSAMGFEGPALLAGATVGSAVERRFLWRFRRDDAKVLMVAGAAAGVAAIFKAPLTGVCFALEVPYRADLTRRALPAALAASAAAYVTYVLIVGTAPLFETGGAASFDITDLGAALALGIACGVLARIGAGAIAVAKALRLPRTGHVLLAVSGLSVVGGLAWWWFGAPLHLGPGYKAIGWVGDDGHSAAVLVGLFAVRAAATWCCVGGGAVGGLFIPLVTQGYVLGAVVQQLAPASNAALFPTIGIAAFLGAGYRTPLAGVAFVAEATGQPFFVVPALLAAAASQLVMGRATFSPYQRGERAPDIEPLTRLTLRDVMTPNPDTIDAALPLDEAVTRMLAANRRWAPVLGTDGGYAGLLAVTDLAKVPRAEWPHRRVAEIARADVPAAAADETVLGAAARMRAAGVEAVAVLDGDAVVGILTRRDIANVEILLDRLSADADHS